MSMKNDIEKDNKKVIDEYQKKSDIKNMMSTGFSYINWLIEFSKKHYNFCNNSILYNMENLSKDDKNNIDLLSNFFEVIEEFALEKSYCSYKNNVGGYFYLISYKYDLIEIGNVNFDSDLLYVNRIVGISDLHCMPIPFESLVNGKNNVDYIQKDLEIKTTMKKYLKEGVPFETLKYLLNRANMEHEDALQLKKIKK